MPRVDGTGQIWLTTDELQKTWFGGEIPEIERFRRYYGRNITPAVIEQVMLAATWGYMRDLTDLSYETLVIDPHLSSVVGKRVRALAAIEPKIVPATGDGIDAAKAAFYADVVRQQIAWIPNFRQRTVQLTWAHYHGRSLLEKVWKENPPGSKVRWRVDQLTWVHPRRLSFGPDREIRIRDDLWTGVGGWGIGDWPGLGGWGAVGFEARGFDTREVPQKFISLTPSLFNDYPEREGLAPRCLYWAYFKRFTWRERMVLLEVFGKPWRIVEVAGDANVTVTPEVLDKAKDTADKLGANASAAMPRGVSLTVEQPAEGAGQVHKDVGQECDDQMSKLVLGQTRTTDAKPNAIGSEGDRVAQDAESLVIAADGWNVGDVYTDQLAGDIIRLNFGPDELSHCPRVEIKFEQPPDRTKEIDRTSKAISIGMPLKLDEVYERIGFTRPEGDDATIQQAPGASGGLLGPALPTVRIIDPNAPAGADGGAAASGNAADEPGPGPGTTPTPGAPPSSSMGESGFDIGVGAQASIVTVNEARANIGLPPLERADGSLDPDGNLTIDEFKSKRTTLGENVADAAVPPPEQPMPAISDVAGGEPAIAAAVRREAELLRATVGARARFGDHVCCAQQPGTVNGSPEVLIDSGVRESARITKTWSDALVDSVTGLDTPGDIFEALTQAANGLPLVGFARAAERRILHGVMLGALDSTWERENEALVALEHFTAQRVLAKEPGTPSFVGKPFAEAIRLFKSREILSKDKFEQLTAAAKRRAFTVARLARQELLVAAHAELSRQLESAPATGPDLSDFRTFVSERLESAGWTPANPSHVETIYRTNVVSAYSAGRHAEMTEPAVLEARPVWGIMGVRDDRQRATHRAAHGTMLPASHEFWKRAYAPFGYNCRCRVISRGKAYLDRVTAVPEGLPDEGFTSGVSSLLGSDL